MMAVATTTSGEKDGLGSPAGAADEIGVLRGELKAWEKDFASQNGRKPTPDDIEADESVRRRYKAYAKLKSRSKTPMGSECRPVTCDLSCPFDELFILCATHGAQSRMQSIERSLARIDGATHGWLAHRAGQCIKHEPRLSRYQGALHFVNGKRLKANPARHCQP